MDSRTAASGVTDPDAVEFVRFCYRRRRVGWPELYDEMCAVAGRGLFRGLDADDLAGLGIGFSLFDMPALAVLAGRVIADEHALRRPMAIPVGRDVTAGPDQISERRATPVEAVADRAVAPARPYPLRQVAARDETSFDVPVRLALASSAV
jgi:hypothetical protein